MLEPLNTHAQVHVQIHPEYINQLTTHGLHNHADPLESEFHHELIEYIV